MLQALGYKLGLISIPGSNTGSWEPQAGLRKLMLELKSLLEADFDFRFSKNAGHFQECGEENILEKLTFRCDVSKHG